MTKTPAVLFEQFVASGYARSKFTKELYRALNLSSFGFIAHFNLDGFYAARFAGCVERVETFAQILERPATGPFERAVQDRVRSDRLLDRASQEAAEELEASERAELARLVAKYGVPA